jgi:hypothetical protein
VVWCGALWGGVGCGRCMRIEVDECGVEGGEGIAVVGAQHQSLGELWCARTSFLFIAHSSFYSSLMLLSHSFPSFFFFSFFR